MFLKKWKQEIRTKLIKEVTEDVRVQVSKSMTDIINMVTHDNGKLLTNEYGVRWDITNISNAFKSAVETQCFKYLDKIDKRMDTLINDKIKSEEFIDSIVDRILKKQLVK